MKLLIVDDEAFTRNGLLNAISWDDYGFTEVLQADDGIHGLELALKHQPDIVICDVRMPRMDGIKMSNRIKELYPDTLIIFMSGYSDKEYLKAAIKLQAINYLEKPLVLEEIQQTIIKAVQTIRKIKQNQRSEVWQYLENSSRLALLLTSAYTKSSEAITTLCSELNLTNMEKAYFTTFLIRIIGEDVMNTEKIKDLYHTLTLYLQKYQLASLNIERHQQYFILHIYGTTAPKLNDLSKIAAFIHTQLDDFHCHYLSFGETVCGIRNVYHSYEEAVYLMQSSFFYGTKVTLHKEITKQKINFEQISAFFEEDYATKYFDALLSKNKEEAFDILQKIYEFFYENNQVLVVQAKDIFYKLYTFLQNACRKTQIPEECISDFITENIISYLEHFNSYSEMHWDLVNKTTIFFDKINTVSEENATIFMIKEYISKNYQNENLSVKDISEHVHFSASYVCTFFKNETGKTLNQYLMEYRMEKAKKLLQDPRYRIAEISSKIGYNDGNYFGKSFKKYVGLSPSEYREKMLN